MKLTNKQIKQIIKEEIRKLLNENPNNDLIGKDGFGYQSYLQSFRYINGDYNSPVDSPYMHAEHIKQCLRAIAQKLASGGQITRAKESINSLRDLMNQGISDPENVHPQLKNIFSKQTRIDNIMEFLDWAENKIQNKIGM